MTEIMRPVDWCCSAKCQLRPEGDPDAGPVSTWAREIDRLRAELDQTRLMHLDAEQACEKAEARLAAVIALCDDQEVQSSYYGERAWLRISLVRAAATGTPQ